MAKRREIGAVSFYRVPLTISVEGPLYASSPTSSTGIEAALTRNMPSDAQLAYREDVGLEELRPLEEIRKEKERSAEMAGKGPSTIFLRDRQGRPYLHCNYIKGHLREMADDLSRLLNFWGFQAFVTSTVSPTPEGIYLGGEIKTAGSHFAPKVRLATGVTVRQPTEKIAEYVVSPTLSWVLYLVADPRWTRDLLDDVLLHGAMRGLGPGRAEEKSKYTYELGDFEELHRHEGLKRYRRDLRAWGEAAYSGANREVEGDRLVEQA